MKKFNIKQLPSLKGKKVNQTIKLICGDKIGSGAHRDVYILKQNPEYVVKIERDMSNGNFANVTEWRNYIDNKYWTWFEQWLAPCEMINETGQILIQRRVVPGRRKDYPKYIPKRFTDLKITNFGWIGDRFVCCDYSYLMELMERGNKLKYAKWWSLKPKKEK